MGPGQAYGLRISPSLWLEQLLAYAGDPGCTEEVPPIYPQWEKEEPPPLVPIDGTGEIEEGDTYPSAGDAAGESPAHA